MTALQLEEVTHLLSEFNVLEIAEPEGGGPNGEEGHDKLYLKLAVKSGDPIEIDVDELGVKTYWHPPKQPQLNSTELDLDYVQKYAEPA
tara:strand:- start:519 stop:785 length:267 start_codon:yes stop_codon:yes gene_type:complete